MLDSEYLKKLALKFQTRQENIVREYLQHLFLFFLYKSKESENVFFKGGSALRIIYQSPRFSEDLDFSGKNFLFRRKKIESIFLEVLSQIEKENIKIELKEAKFTSGGYLGILSYNFLDFKGEIFFEVSLRKKEKPKGETQTIVGEYLPAYLIFSLSPQQLVKEKISALLERGKPRDYYDLYFILRHPELKKFLSKEDLEGAKEKLKKEKINFKRELEILLPISHHPILKNFKERISQEIEKYLL